MAVAKLPERARKGFHEFERGLQTLPDAKSVQLTSTTLETDEVMLLVVTRNETIVRRKLITGRDVTLKEIYQRLVGAEAAIDDLAATPVASPQLSVAEAELLDSAGLGVAPDSAPSGLARSRVELELMIRNSFTIDQVAAALDVTTGRIRQRLSYQRTLFGFKDGRRWRIPKFQFAGKRLVRNIGVVLPRIRPDAHPLVVKVWFTQPHQDLVVGDDDRHVSPIDWLASGGAPEIVADLASEV